MPAAADENRLFLLFYYLLVNLINHILIAAYKTVKVYLFRKIPMILSKVFQKSFVGGNFEDSTNMELRDSTTDMDPLTGKNDPILAASRTSNALPPRPLSRRDSKSQIVGITPNTDMQRRLSRAMSMNRISESSLSSFNTSYIYPPHIAALRGDLDSLKEAISLDPSIVLKPYNYDYQYCDPLMKPEEELDKSYFPPSALPKHIRLALSVEDPADLTRDQRWLLTHAFRDSSLLHYACAGGQLTIVKFLLSQGADRSFLNAAKKPAEIFSNREEIIEYIWSAPPASPEIVARLKAALKSKRGVTLQDDKAPVVAEVVSNGMDPSPRPKSLRALELTNKLRASIQARQEKLNEELALTLTGKDKNKQVEQHSRAEGSEAGDNASVASGCSGSSSRRLSTKRMNRVLSARKSFTLSEDGSKQLQNALQRRDKREGGIEGQQRTDSALSGVTTMSSISAASEIDRAPSPQKHQKAPKSGLSEELDAVESAADPDEDEYTTEGEIVFDQSAARPRPFAVMKKFAVDSDGKLKAVSYRVTEEGEEIIVSEPKESRRSSAARKASMQAKKSKQSKGSSDPTATALDPVEAAGIASEAALLISKPRLTPEQLLQIKLNQVEKVLAKFKPIDQVANAILREHTSAAPGENLLEKLMARSQFSLNNNTASLKETREPLADLANELKSNTADPANLSFREMLWRRAGEHMNRELYEDSGTRGSTELKALRLEAYELGLRCLKSEFRSYALKKHWEAIDFLQVKAHRELEALRRQEAADNASKSKSASRLPLAEGKNQSGSDSHPLNEIAKRTSLSMNEMQQEMVRLKEEIRRLSLRPEILGDDGDGKGDGD